MIVTISFKEDKPGFASRYPARTLNGHWSDHSVMKCHGLKLQARKVEIKTHFGNYFLYLTKGDKKYPFSTSFYFYPDEVIEMKLMDKLDKILEE